MKLNTLFHLAQLPSIDLPNFQAEMEKFDRIKVEGMRFAEHQCRRLRMGMIQFSLELMIWRQKKELWHLVMHCKSGHHVHAQTIH